MAASTFCAPRECENPITAKVLAAKSKPLFKNFISTWNLPKAGSLQGLDISHQVMDIGIGIFAELRHVSLDRGIDFDLYVTHAPGSIGSRSIPQSHREFVQILQ